MANVYKVTEGPIFEKLVKIALPVLLTSISQMAYNLTDMFWIGRVDDIGGVESEALSGIGTAGYLTWLAFGLILLGKIGTSVKVSHSLGANNYPAIDKYASNGLMFMTIMGVIVSALIFLFRTSLIGLFGLTNQAAYQNGVTYLSIVGGFFFLQFVMSGFSAVNEGLGKTKTNFKVMLIGLVLNMLLDPLFILVFRWGVAGAAIATVIAQAATLSVFILIHSLQKNKLYRFNLRTIDKKAVGEIARLGLPSGLQSMLFTMISMVIARMIILFGDDVLAAQRIGVQIEQFTWMIAGGFQTALTVFVGQNFGAGKFDRIRQGAGLISAILLPYSIIVGLVIMFESEFLIGIFVDDPIVIAHGAKYLKIIGYAQFFMMLEGIGAGLFNGVGKTIIPSVSGIAFNLVRIPLALLLIESMAELGIWWTLNISDMLKGTFLLVAGLIMLTRLETIFMKQKTKADTRLKPVYPE